MREDIEYEQLLKRYNNSQNTIEVLQRRYEQALARIAVLEAKGEQWESAKITQSEIVQHQIGQSDNKVAQLQNEIIELKELLKENNIEFED
jgi:hypothetical protein